MNTQKLRWKKRKYYIRINCGIMIALFVAILFLMGFPIVSDANPAYENLKDFCYITEICNQEACEDYFNSNNSSLPSDLWYKRAFLPYDDAMKYFDDVKYIIDNFNVSYFSGTGLNPNSIDSPFAIYTLSNDDSKLAFVISPNFNFNSRYGNFEISQGGSCWYFDRNNKTFSDYHSDQYVSNMGRILVCNKSINASGYYQNGGRWTPINTTDINYSYLNGANKYGSNLTDNGFDVPEPDPVIYPDGSGGEIINNMYLRTADWKFNIPQYWTNTNFVNSNPTDKWGSGNVQFYGLVNDFQKANVSDYNLKFDYYLQLVGSYDGGVSFAHSYALRGVNYPLSDFLSNNNTYQVGIDYIFTNATDINGNNIYTTLEDLRGGQISQVNFSKWELSCSAHLESDNYTSGSIQETYSFLTQISKEVNNTITENNNPYYPPDYDDTSSSNNNNSVVTSKDGQIVLTNYDNDSLVIDNGHDEVINTLYDKLVPDNVTGESGLTQRFLSLTNANQWFTVMTSSLAIFPQEFWTTIYTIFLASLGIIGTAFLLWIVVHIL